MGDMHEAGRKAWAKRQLNEARRDAETVRDLYRSGFSSPAKEVARRRAIRALQAAGGKVCLDLWGGGLSASELLAAGFSVISVDDGSLILAEHERHIGSARKQRALEMTAAEDGYEARWGVAAKFANEADVAWLDFCGPWSNEVRRTIEACRHMKALVITLVTDHDIATDATIQEERRLAYEAFLHRAFGDPCYRRRLASYKRPGGQPVWVYVISRQRLGVISRSAAETIQLNPEMRAIYTANHKRYMTQHPEKAAAYEAKRRDYRMSPAYKAVKNARRREQWANNAEWRARHSAYQKAYMARRRAEAG